MGALVSVLPCPCLPPPDPSIRFARGDDDPDAIARVWYESYQASHAHLVDPMVMRHRDLDSFKMRVRVRLANKVPTLLAVDGHGVCVGLAVLNPKEAEVEQLFVRRTGHGIGSRLLRAAEQELVRYGIRHSHLCCVAGNTPAFGFYERHGWKKQARLIEYMADTGNGGVVKVLCVRYDKELSESPARRRNLQDM
mmetsp:Transcript_19387/g.35089  ORF Transcript_19387/g.35089 Transcript_19387/m.35089 type:complete len:194 (-) Transcript_19387:12-593(-)